MTEFTWAYLHILELGRAPLTALAAGIFATLLQTQIVQRRQPMRWIVLVNYAFLAQFAIMLLAWFVLAAAADRNYYFFILNFFLVTWTCLPFFILACLVPLFARRESRA
ncbi:hypothetical protein [Pseudoduganella sp. HUAS MS19]